MGYYWPTMKKDTVEFVKKCHSCQVQVNLIHAHLQNLHNMVTPWPFHTWGLDSVGPVNPPLRGYIWILMATKYFTKWVEAIPLCKAIGGAVANFIKENIIIKFGVPHRIISDKWQTNCQPWSKKHARVLSNQTPPIITLLPPKEWADKSNKQNPYQDH